jgi:hypothetical protein
MCYFFQYLGYGWTWKRFKGWTLDFYILRGTDTPKSANPFLSTCATAPTKAKRACFKCASSTKILS